MRRIGGVPPQHDGRAPRRSRRGWSTGLVVAALLAVTACSGGAGTAEQPAAPAAGDTAAPVAFVVEGTVGTYGALDIGAADFGRTAVYAMLAGPESTTSTTLRVGEPVVHDGYTVELLGIDGQTASFRVVDPDGDVLG
jgi:hypothetical protein